MLASPRTNQQFPSGLRGKVRLSLVVAKVPVPSARAAFVATHLLD